MSAAPSDIGGTAQCLVVSGFLGSGKTTLVRRLLEQGQAEGIRTAVVSNEFGELGIDEALLASAEGDGDFVELAGGCVCCRLSDDLLRTLEKLWERSQPERVVVETSGVALPYDTLLNFWREPVCQWAIDASSVVVVSATQLAQGRDLHGTFEDQVCSADLMLLSKTDLMSATEAARVESVLRAIEPEVPILHASFGEVDARVFFPPEPGRSTSKQATRGRESAPHAHEGAHSHSHDDFYSEELAFPAGIAVAELERALAARAALRAKGFVATSDGVRVVQGVSTHIEVTTPGTMPPAHLVGRVVVIDRRPADGERKTESTGATR